jgi:hypothetical protein
MGRHYIGSEVILSIGRRSAHVVRSRTRIQWPEAGAVQLAVVLVGLAALAVIAAVQLS